MTEARDIYQDWIDRVSMAMWAGDDAAVLDLLALPNRMGTLDHMHVFETRDALAETVQSFREGLKRLGAADFHRICNQADFDPNDPDRITGNHTTHVLAGGTYVLDPFINEMTLIRRDGVWLGSQNRALVSGSHYSAVNTAHIRGGATEQN